MQLILIVYLVQYYLRKDGNLNTDIPNSKQLAQFIGNEDPPPTRCLVFLYSGIK